MKTAISQRRQQLLNHIALLEKRYPESDRRAAIAALKNRLWRLQENSRSFVSLILIKCRSMAATWLLKWVPNLVIDGWFPGLIGRYRVIDTLIFWSEDDEF